MILDRTQWMLAALLLVLTVMLGGGQGTLGDSACQLLAIGLIAATLWRHQVETKARLPKMAWLAALPLALPLLQLLPLPDLLWLAPPAREQIALELALAGQEPASRLSLVPLASERAGLWLLPAVALFLSALQFDTQQRYRLLQLLVVLAGVSAVLGLAQLAGGTDSPLRFYAITNPTESVGFFANRNHFASLLAMSLPIVFVGSANALAQSGASDPAGWWLRLAVGAGLAGLLVLGIALSRSRAGLLLGMLAVLLSLPAVLELRQRRGTRRVLALVLGLGLVLTVQFALFGILQRFERDPLEDARFKFAELTIEAASDHAPLGTGLGGFRRAFEAKDATAPTDVYANHAHNDYAELWLEGGWLALLVALPLGLVLAAGGWRAWRPGHGGSPLTVGLARAASIGLLVAALHSLVDYPLRTTAVLTVVGLLAAVLLSALRNGQVSAE